MLGVGYKLVSQPIRRNACIIALVPVTVLSRLVDVHICPVTTTNRGIEGFKNYKLAATAKNGLLYCTYFFDSGELIQFLQPEVFKISPAGLDGLRFLCLVQPPEDDFLPRGPIYILHGADAGGPQVIGSQCVNRPCNLFKHGFPKGIPHLTEYYRVAENAVLCVLHHTQYDFHGDERGFTATATAIARIISVLAIQYVPVDGVKGGGYDVCKLDFVRHHSST